MPLGNQEEQKGFVLIGLLLTIMMTGFITVQFDMKWSEAMKRQREDELLRVGELYREAIGQYYQQTPSTVKQYPPTLDVLLRDERLPVPKRYLRKLYQDPVTQRDGWGIVEAPSGGIMGIYSLSDQLPYRQNGFWGGQKSLNKQTYYGAWHFIYSPTSSRF